MLFWHLFLLLLTFRCQFVVSTVPQNSLTYDSAIWAQTAEIDRAATTGDLFLQPCSIEQHLSQKRGSGP